MVMESEWVCSQLRDKNTIQGWTLALVKLTAIKKCKKKSRKGLFQGGGDTSRQRRRRKQTVEITNGNKNSMTTEEGSAQTKATSQVQDFRRKVKEAKSLHWYGAASVTSRKKITFRLTVKMWFWTSLASEWHLSIYLWLENQGLTFSSCGPSGWWCFVNEAKT